MSHTLLGLGRRKARRVTSENLSGTSRATDVRCRHLVPDRPSDSALERRIRFACCWLVTGVIALVGLGCACSPRAEYLQTRSIEVKPTSDGDGTTLAQRDDVMRGRFAGATAVVPLAAVKADSDGSAQ